MNLTGTTTGGTPLSIAVMDHSYVMCEEENTKGVIVDVHCRHLSPCWPNPLYSTYYTKLLDVYGVGPVFVWEGKRIVGFLPVSVSNCGIPELPLCVHYNGGLAYGAEQHIDLPMVQNAKAIPFEKLSSKEIKIGCMTVHPGLRGKGLAVSMIEHLAHWARDRGWERVRARAMLDGESEAFYPTSSWWKELGFRPVGGIRPFGPSRNPIDRSKAIDLELDLRE
jgi:GNAT superfamily N-acetyltransferase